MRLFIGVPVPNLDFDWTTLTKYPSFKPTKKPLHITLSFLGNKSLSEVLPYFRTYFQNKPSFEVILKGIGGFPSMLKARVIFIRAIFSYDIMKDWKYEKNEIFHVTLGRANPPLDISNISYKTHEFGSFHVKSVFLYNSNFKRYEPIEEVKLV